MNELPVVDISIKEQKIFIELLKKILVLSKELKEVDQILDKEEYEEKKKQKERKDMLGNLKRNDEVVTASGIHGTVVNIKPDTIVLRVDDNVKIEFDKEAIVTIKKSTT